MNDDYQKGLHGDYMPNSYGNQEYARGEMDARIRKLNAEWLESQEASMRNQNNETYGGYSGGSTPMSPQAARLVAKIFFIIVFLGFIAFLVAMAMASVNEKEQMDAVAAKEAATVAAKVAHQKKLLENRKPFHYHGYTLYSDTSPTSRYLDFHITNAAGKTIWTEPSGMENRFVSESRPMGDITGKYDLRPGQVQFIIMAQGPHYRYSVMYRVCIDHRGQVSWQGPYHAPYKPGKGYHPSALPPMPVFK